MDDARLDDLARSIKANGVIQPIVVRRDGDRFQIIAGERRWRAAQKAGLHARAGRRPRGRDGQERSLLEMALVENIQRENLNPIDEALAYRRLSDEFRLTQEEIAAAVGKDRASVANFLRLLKSVRRSPGGSRVGHVVDGTRAGAALADRRSRPAPRRARRDRAQPVGARDRVARRKIERGAKPTATVRRRNRSTCTHAPPRIACGSRSARASASSARDRAGESKSTSARRTN